MSYIDTLREKALAEIRLEDLRTETQRELAETIGMETLVCLSRIIGGTPIYIPTIEELTRNYIYKEALKSKGVLSAREAAKIYGLSESQAYKIFREAGNK